MRFIQLKKILIFAVLAIACASAFGADCNTSGYPCINVDSQIKGSRWPAWGVDSGTANAYAVTTVAPLGPALKTGSKIQFIAVHSNTTASTLAVNGGSAIPLVNPPATALTSGNIVAGDVIEAVYDGTNFQCITCATSSGGGVSGSGMGTIFTAKLPGGADQVGGGLTDWMIISGETGLSATSIDHDLLIPVGCTAQNLMIEIGGTQPASGSLVVTLFDVTAGTATTLSVTVPASSAAGTFSDTTHTPSLIGGHRYEHRLTNNATTFAASTQGVAFQCK